jgi:DNA-binding PadR family transcriptional regulator
MNDLLLLATLLEGPRHGYALKKQAGLILGEAEMHNNLVYPLLRRFVKNGWVNKSKAKGQRGQTRELYSLTASGRNALVGRLAEFSAAEARSDDEFLLRVALFALLNPETRRSILSQRDEFLAHRQERTADLMRPLNAGHDAYEVLRFIKERLIAERAWITRLRKRTDRGVPPTAATARTAKLKTRLL